MVIYRVNGLSFQGRKYFEGDQGLGCLFYVIYNFHCIKIACKHSQGIPYDKQPVKLPNRRKAIWISSGIFAGNQRTP